MECDYKIISIMRGKNTKIEARFYVGETSEIEEPDDEGNLIPITRYRRNEKVSDVSYLMTGNKTDEEVNADLISRLADFATAESLSLGLTVSTIQEQTNA